MLSKIFLTGQGFGQTCKYVCQDLYRAEILDFEGVRGHDYRLIAEDFDRQFSFMPEKEKPVFHGALTFPPGEDPGDEKMIRIARDYLREIKMTPTQFVIVKHSDKEHLHLHIVANKVNDIGEPTGKGLIVERGIKAARKLTREYGLRPQRGKNLELTHLEALHEPDAKRYRLYQAIQRHLPASRDMDELEKRLLEEGITTRYRLNPVDGVREGISFRIENRAFGGYRVDPAFTYKNLERTLALQRELALEQQLALERKLAREQELSQEWEHRLRHSRGLGL